MNLNGNHLGNKYFKKMGGGGGGGGGGWGIRDGQSASAMCERLPRMRGYHE